MCWNQYVSINTFVFGIFGLLLIFFNNKYSSYKLPAFNNEYTYLFLLSFILMQLIEFVLWRNVRNRNLNRIFSSLGLLLLVVQPIASLYLLTNISLRNKLLLLYSIPAIIFLVYNLFNTNIHTVISPCNHLSWKWASYNNMTVESIVKMYYLFFLFFSLFYNGYNKIIFLLLLYFIFLYYFHKDGSSGSIWCLSVNVVVLYFVLQILVVMPYNEITNNK